jgi:hypothetical protein
MNDDTEIIALRARVGEQAESIATLRRELSDAKGRDLNRKRACQMLTKQLDDERTKPDALAAAKARIAELEAECVAGRTLTCAFCGQAYPPGTPGSQHELLTAHVAKCEKHPMRAVEARLAKAMAALAGLVGSSDRAELKQMEAMMRVTPAPDADKIAALNAIHCMLAATGQIGGAP